VQTRLAAGIPKGTALKAIDESILGQIDSAMADSRTMLMTRRKRSRISTTKNKSQTKTLSHGGDDDGTARGEGLQEVLDDECYDDTDFFNAMLADVTSSAYGLSDGEVVTKKLPNHKRDVMRRATKGRHIRYVPIPKLMNFMAPQPRATGGNLDDESTFPTDRLFANLFGSSSSRV